MRGASFPVPHVTAGGLCRWKPINKEDRHVGLDFYDLLIEGHYTQISAAFDSVHIGVIAGIFDAGQRCVRPSWAHARLPRTLVGDVQGRENPLRRLSDTSQGLKPKSFCALTRRWKRRSSTVLAGFVAKPDGTAVSRAFQSGGLVGPHSSKRSSTLLQQRPRWS